MDGVGALRRKNESNMEREREREREKERERERAYAGLTPSRAGRGSADGRLLSESMSRDV